MTARVTLLVNGLGLGNSTRCHAIIQRLAENGAAIEVITSGNGLWYFADRKEVERLHEIESLYYARRGDSLSIGATFASAGALIGIQRRNARRVAAILADRRPDVVVLDSMYTVRPVRRLGIPLAALNNADVVWHSYRRFGDAPASVRPQFYAVETPDFLFHRLVPDLVVSPTLDPAVPGGGGRVVRVGPIVRRGYDPAPRSAAAERVVIMLSGSAFGTPVQLRRSTHSARIEIVGRDAPPGWTPRAGVMYHGRVLDTQPILRDADLAVVNGGFSAVSEMFWMRKPLVVVPVPRHAEQWINARTIERLGVGLMAREDNYEEVMVKALDRIDEFRRAYDALPPMADGAAQACAAILRLAGKGAG